MIVGMAVAVVSRPIESRAVSDFIDSAGVKPSGLLIEGKAGIGKTTLWFDALARARDRGFRVLSTRAGQAESALAAAGEVFVSNTVKGLVNGSGITFRDCGTHALKGLPGEWQLFSPSGQQDDPVESLLAASQEL